MRIPGAATRTAQAALRIGGRDCLPEQFPVEIGVEDVRDPFPDVPGGVEQTVRSSS